MNSFNFFDLCKLTSTRYRFFILILFFSYKITAQNTDFIKKYKGLWIAKAYYESFEKTKSAIASKKAFYFNEPVGFRINPDKVKDSILYVGYAQLHSHTLHADAFDYTLWRKDTISQGHLGFNISKKTKGFYPKTATKNDYYTKIAGLKFIDNQLVAIESNGNKIPYIKITSTPPYPSSNPLYHYTREVVLKGNYKVKDSTRTIISNNISINEKGIITGIPQLEGYAAIYSTDIYCGPPPIDDLVIFCKELDSYSNCKRFVIKPKGNKIKLYKASRRDIFTKKQKLGKPVYILIKQ